MKTLRVGELRFIVKKIDKLFRVYDKARGSYPYHSPELGGEIVQDVDEAAAEAEAERLNKKFVKQAPKLEQKKTKKVEAETAEPAEEVDIPELPDYGEPLTEEEAARYEDGLMEEVKY